MKSLIDLLIPLVAKQIESGCCHIKHIPKDLHNKLAIFLHPRTQRQLFNKIVYRLCGFQNSRIFSTIKFRDISRRTDSVEALPKINGKCVIITIYNVHLIFKCKVTQYEEGGFYKDDFEILSIIYTQLSNKDLSFIKTIIINKIRDSTVFAYKHIQSFALVINNIPKDRLHHINAFNEYLINKYELYNSPILLHEDKN